MSLQWFFNKVVTFQRPRNVKDTSGGPLRSSPTDWDDVVLASAVPCSVQPLRYTEKYTAAQAQTNITHRIYMDTFVPVKKGDRAVMTDEHRTIIFVVQELKEFAGRDTIWVVDAREQMA